MINFVESFGEVQVSRVGSSSEVNYCMVSMVDRLSLNPYWLSYKTLYFFRTSRVCYARAV